MRSSCAVTASRGLRVHGFSRSFSALCAVALPIAASGYAGRPESSMFSCRSCPRIWRTRPRTTGLSGVYSTP